MANEKKLFRVSMIVTHDILHDIMSIASGKSYNLEVAAVKSATDTATGEPTSRPSMREWLIGFIAEHAEFTTKSAGEAAITAGYSKPSIYGALNEAAKNKLIKRTGPGEYRTTGKVAPASKPRGRPATTTRPKPGESMREQVIAILKNANGTPMPLGTLKEKLAAKGHAITGVSPVLTMMMSKKLVKRPEPSHYLLTAKGSHAEAAAAVNGQ